MKRILLCSILCLMLLVTGCGQQDAPTLAEGTEITQLGEGNTGFLFTVTDQDGTQTAYEIHTNQTTVGAALQELSLIQGNAGPYGLYVTTVDGIAVDYNKDGKYWAFYADGSYSATAVDQTPIKEGMTYGFRVE